jgi:hypothetical protein
VLPRDRDARTHTRPRNENYKATPQQYNYRTINQPIYLSIYQSTIDVSLVTNQTQCLGQRTYTRNSLLTQQSYACETVATTRDSTKNLSTERGEMVVGLRLLLVEQRSVVGERCVKKFDCRCNVRLAKYLIHKVCDARQWIAGYNRGTTTRW